MILDFAPAVLSGAETLSLGAGTERPVPRNSSPDAHPCSDLRTPVGLGF